MIKIPDYIEYKGYYIFIETDDTKHGFNKRIVIIEKDDIPTHISKLSSKSYMVAKYDIGNATLKDKVYQTMAKGLIDHVFLGDEVADVIKDIDFEWVKYDLKVNLQDEIIKSLFEYTLKFNKPTDILPEDNEYVLILLDSDRRTWEDEDDLCGKRFYVVAQYDEKRKRFDFGPDYSDIDEVKYWSYLPNYIKEESQ